MGTATKFADFSQAHRTAKRGKWGFSEFKTKYILMFKLKSFSTCHHGLLCCGVLWIGV